MNTSTFSSGGNAMDSSQALVLILFIPLALQILLPLFLLAGFTVIRLVEPLLSGFCGKAEHSHTGGKEDSLHLEQA
jgi:hypothetical protein